MRTAAQQHPFAAAAPQEEKWQITGLLRQLAARSLFLITLQCPNVLSELETCWASRAETEETVVTAVVFTDDSFRTHLRLCGLFKGSVLNPLVD